MAFAIGAKGEVSCYATRRDVSSGISVPKSSWKATTSLKKVVVLSMNAEGTEVDAQPDVLVVKDVESGEVVQRVEKGRTEDVFNCLADRPEFVVESENARESAIDSMDVMAAVDRRRFAIRPPGAVSVR